MKNSLASDILEQQFGPSELTVLYQDDLTRIICTKVIASGQVLELARVQFIQSGVDKFPDVHQAIVAGQSMGKAFRAHNIAFTRQTNFAYHCTLPNNFSQWFGSSNSASVVAADILVGSDHSIYAHILEVYSPAVTWPDAGNEPNDEQRNEIQLFNTLLEEIKPNVP